MQSLVGLGNAVTLHTQGIGGNAGELLGSPNLYDQWLSGTVFLKDGKSVQRDSAFNINAADWGGLNILLPNGDAIDVRESLISRTVIQAEDGEHIYKPFPAHLFDEKLQGDWLLRVLFEKDEIVFLRHERKTLREADFTGPYASGRRYHEYIVEVSYYIGVDDVLTKVRLRKSVIADVLPDVAAQIKGVIDEASIVFALNKVYGSAN
jgi:hypothetical protein